MLEDPSAASKRRIQQRDRDKHPRLAVEDCPAGEVLKPAGNSEQENCPT